VLILGNWNGLTRENSGGIGFVVKCLGCEAIELAELHEWCYSIIRQKDVEEIPPYIFELAEYSDAFAKIFKTIGFVPEWRGSKRDEYALFGIAVRCGRTPFDWPIKPDAAVAALEANPEIEKKFRETFPFVTY
jgi:hypothetical protein